MNKGRQNDRIGTSIAKCQQYLRTGLGLMGDRGFASFELKILFVILTSPFVIGGSCASPVFFVRRRGMVAVGQRSGDLVHVLADDALSLAGCITGARIALI